MSKHAAVHSDRLPSGIVVQARSFEFRDLDAVPQYWFAGNSIATHLENAFSVLIPPGERFFIRAVRAFADEATEDERPLVQAFVQQEAFHTRAHTELNASFARFGIDIDREVAYADRVFARMQRVLPARTRLGVTAFLEHLTASAAHLMFGAPVLDDALDPEMRRFWRWHAAEELEHKAVAFDLYRRAGGRYLSRVACALIAASWLAFPFARIAWRMMRDDPHRPTRAERRQLLAIDRQLLGPQLRLVAAYFRPGFHPWQADDAPLLRDWYASDELDAD